jgi:hypothetical protein
MNNQFSIPGIKKLFVHLYQIVVRKFPIRSYQSFLMFVFFVSLATILWLLKVLNKENHSNIINYPVTYVNFPNNKVLVNELPKTLSIEVSGKGFTLLKYMLRPKLKSIRFDVNSFSLNELEGQEGAFYTLTRYANQKLNNHFENEIEVRDISPDTLKFLFSERVFKEVPIKLQADINTGKLFMINGPVQITPDTVKVSGPSLVIDTIDHVSTSFFALSEITDSVRKEVPLKPSGNVQLSQETVEVHVPVDKYTTKTVQVPIQIEHVPDTVSMKIFPASVSVSFKVAISQYDAVTADDFRVTVSFTSIQESISSQLRLNIAAYPDIIQSPALRKRTVEYLIER